MHVSAYSASDTSDAVFFLSLAITGGALVAAPIAAYAWWKARTWLAAALVAFWWLGPWVVAAMTGRDSLRQLFDDVFLLHPENTFVPIWPSPAFGLILGFAFVVRIWRKWISKVRAEVRG